MWQDIWAVNLKCEWNNSHWWKTLQMLKMWKDIWAVNLKQTWNNSHWWKNQPSVSYFMHISSWLLKCLVTFWAAVWFFTSVSYFLHISSWLFKCLVTFWALVWFLNNGETLVQNYQVNRLECKKNATAAKEKLQKPKVNVSVFLTGFFFWGGKMTGFLGSFWGLIYFKILVLSSRNKKNWCCPKGGYKDLVWSRRYWFWSQGRVRICVVPRAGLLSFCHERKKFLSFCHERKKILSFCHERKKFLSFCHERKKFLSFCPET